MRKLGVKYITSSRSGARFESDMKSFLEEEAIDGVDVVLNSLSHDDYISRSLSFLRSGGRFIEIGKRGIWSHQPCPQKSLTTPKASISLMSYVYLFKIIQAHPI